MFFMNRIPMYIESVPNRKSPPAILLREGKRVGNKVVKRTLANLTRWPKPVVERLRTLLKEDSFSYERNQKRIAKEAALDGFYVIRTSVSAKRMDAKETVRTYKSLSRVEQAFRSLCYADIFITIGCLLA